MNLALDTSAYSEFMRGDRNRVFQIQSAQSVVIPLIVIGELRGGFLMGSRSLQNEQTLQRFLNQPRVSVLNPDDATSHRYAQLVQQLRQQGTPIPTNDVWIAALSLQHNLVLCTSDGHFDHIRQLPKY